MPRIEESVDIQCPVDKVFAFVTNTENMPKWASNVTGVEQTSAGHLGVGTSFKGTIKLMGLRMAWTSKVTEFEPSKKWAGVTSSGSSIVEERFTFDPVKGGTKFTLAEEVEAGGLVKVFAPLLLGSMRRGMKKNLKNLKAVLETQN